MKNTEIKISGAYIILGLSWIVFSKYFGSTTTSNLTAENKGNYIFLSVAIIFCTGILFYFIVKYFISRLNETLLEHRSIFENSPNPILLIEQDSLRISDFNLEAIKYCGINRIELINKDIRSLIRYDAFDNLKQKINTKKVFSGDLGVQEVILSNGCTRKVNLFAHSIRLNGKESIALTLFNVAENHSFEERISEILENMTDGFIALDSNWNCIYLNKEFEQLFNISKTEIIGKSIFESFPTISSNSIGQILFNTKENNKLSSFIEYYQPTNSWLFAKLYPEKNGMSVFIQDITSFRTTENNIRKQKQNLYSLINATNDLVWSVDPDYKLISANEAFKKQFQLQTSIQAIEHVSLIHDSYPNEVVELWKTLYNRALNGEEYQIETELVNKDGRTEYMETHFNPIKNEAGFITGTGCVSRNITERKNQEIKIQHQNTLLREIAWMQSHEVRAPLANIQGLISLIVSNIDEDHEHYDYLNKIDLSCQKLDSQIIRMVMKSNEVEQIIKSEQDSIYLTST